MNFPESESRTQKDVFLAFCQFSECIYFCMCFDLSRYSSNIRLQHLQWEALSYYHTPQATRGIFFLEFALRFHFGGTRVLISHRRFRISADCVFSSRLFCVDDSIDVYYRREYLNFVVNIRCNESSQSALSVCRLQKLLGNLDFCKTLEKAKTKILTGLCFSMQPAQRCAWARTTHLLQEWFWPKLCTK